MLRKPEHNHCPDGTLTLVSKHFLKFATGEHDLNEKEGFEQNIPIKKIILHPKYDSHSNHDYDLALIKLQSPLTYNNRVRPVCLPKFDFSVDTNCYVTGWGHTAEAGDIPQVRNSSTFNPS